MTGAGGKTALVTGAGSGIGRATAQRLLRDGWNVALVGRREAQLHETAGDSDAAMVLPCDVTDEEAVTDAFVQVVDDWGRLDLLFNNAGSGLAATTIDEVDLADWKRVVDLNITGMFLCARAAFSMMRRQSPQGGRIINNGSISATAPRPGSIAYTTTKHAVTGMTKTLSLDGRPFDIACGQIDIGNAETEMTAKMSDGVPQADGSIAPEPKMDVAHVADMVAHMAGLPLASNVLFTTIMATKMPFTGRG